jgi:hypothetical protein
VDELLKGWSGYAWKDGQYVDDIQGYFDRALEGRAAAGGDNTRIAELEQENANLRHDLERSMNNHVADLNQLVAIGWLVKPAADLKEGAE